jgi:hypothetical protein
MSVAILGEKFPAVADRRSGDRLFISNYFSETLTARSMLL